jgi:class 3 adenylate cyclase
MRRAVSAPPVRYARSGDVSIAHYVRGQGPLDLVFVHGFTGNLEALAELPVVVEFEDRLASFSRLIRFDRRGTGLSDRVREVPALETRMDDVRAVMDSVGSQRAVLVGTFEAAAMCMLFAATYPERTTGLVLYNPTARGTWAADYPWAPTPEEWRRELEDFGARWGSDEMLEEWVRDVAPSRAENEEFVRSFGRIQRLSASPGAAVAIRRMAMELDVRDVLPVIRVPSLVITSSRRREEGTYVAQRIPGARHVELSGPDTMIWIQGEPLLAEIERFVQAAAGEAEPDTVLATVLFTDIVGSTEKATELGDTAWRELVERHHALVRRLLDRYRGSELDTAGDGFFATFDGPIRAIRCAHEVCAAVPSLGLEVRAGLHSGECERIEDKLGGLTVNVGARVAALAEGGEVLVSSTVKDLVAGSGIEFEDRGTHELKGVPGEWRLYAVAAA